MNQESLTFIDFFAGIGGFRRGLELAGHKCVGYCEFNRFASASYRAMHTATDEQREYLKTLPLKERQKEIEKEEYLNGEWFSKDIRDVTGQTVPRVDVWCAGFPCQDISVAGKRIGVDGNRSSLYFQIIRILREMPNTDRPGWIFLENVRNLLSINKGWDFARVLIAMDEIGYDAEWQVCNSKDFGVPQNRERIFIVGHLRGRSSTGIFPLEGTNGKDSVRLSAEDTSAAIPVLTPQRAKKRQNGRRFKDDGEPAFTLTSQDRHGVAIEVKTIGGLYTQVTKAFQHGPLADTARALKAATHDSAVVLSVEAKPKLIGGFGEKNFGKQFRQGNRVYDSDALAMCLLSQPLGWAGKNSYLYSVDVEAPKQATKHTGGYIQLSDGTKAYAIWYEKKQCYIAIRRLTPKECFRLQGWADEYFERAQIVNSDSQLYTQAGNGVTVNVIHAIAERF